MKPRLSMAAAIVLVTAAVTLAACGSSTAASFQGTWEGRGIVPQNSAEAKVFIVVKNTGTAEAKPACSVSLSPAGGAYTGRDTLLPDSPLPPGQEGHYSATITVTNNGADHVTKEHSTIACRKA
jgi:hypothetical protein